MKESFILYTEYAKHIGLLDIEQRGVLLTAIMNYQTGESLPEMDGGTAMAFSFIKEQLDRDNAKYEETLKKRSDAGKKGGAPKGNENAKTTKNNQTQAKQANDFSNNQTQAKQADNEHEHVDVYVHDSSDCTSEHSASAREDASEQVEEYQQFMKDHPQVVEDITNPSLIAAVNFRILSEKISQSKFLQTRYSLSWLLSNYRKIAGDAYQDFRRAPPNGDDQLRYLKELYNEADEGGGNAEENGD